MYRINELTEFLFGLSEPRFMGLKDYLDFLFNPVHLINPDSDKFKATIYMLMRYY
jgi:hypothetical protein